MYFENILGPKRTKDEKNEFSAIFSGVELHQWYFGFLDKSLFEPKL